MHYCYYRKIVASDVPLPLSHVETDTKIDYTFSIRHARLLPVPWFGGVHQLTDGTIWLMAGEFATGYRIRFPQSAEFQVHTVESKITAQAVPQTTPDTVAHLLIDQVLPRFLSTQGHTSIHASGVVVNGKAVLFLGQSGYGKSTLASEFYFSGYPGISDDVIFIEQNNNTFYAVQSYPGFRLWSDSLDRHSGRSLSYAPVAHYHAKKRITDIVSTDYPVPIQCVFLLGDPEVNNSGIRIEPLAHQQAFWTLTQHSFRLMPSDQRQMEREFFLFGGLAEQIPICSLTYPHSYASLPDVLQQILNYLDTLG